MRHSPPDAARNTVRLRPAWIEIDVGQLRRNVREVRRVVGPHRLLIVAAKGDAYGHGVHGAVPAMFDAGADVVALGNLRDVIAVREAGCDGPLVLFGTYLAADAAETVVRYRITPTVWYLEGARAFSRAADDALDVYLKIDTGLHRLGVSWEQADRLASEMAALPNLTIRCAYTHFADPIDDEELTRTQYARFVSAVDAMRAAGVHVPFACAGATAILSTRPDMYLNAVDSGRLAYGFYFPPAPPVPLSVAPAARAAKTRIIQTRWIDAGEMAGGYGRFRAPRRTLLAVLPIGWGEGLFPQSALRAKVLVRGRRCTVIAVNLEHCLIDATDAAEAAVGDEVVFFGEQGNAAITVEEYAAWAGVSVWEAIINLGRSLPRIYVGEVDARKDDRADQETAGARAPARPV